MHGRWDQQERTDEAEKLFKSPRETQKNSERQHLTRARRTYTYCVGHCLGLRVKSATEFLSTQSLLLSPPKRQRTEQIEMIPSRSRGLGSPFGAMADYDTSCSTVLDT